jgi:hypothetical protein
VPFLRLTRDRRGFENTFLMHADRPGDRPRLLYWYRTAPGILLGRSPLDEDAIRTIEEQHPDIDFDWPAILALSEVMTPEDEAPVQRPQQQQRRKSASARERPRELRRDESASAREGAPASDFARPDQGELRRDDGAEETRGAVELDAVTVSEESEDEEVEVEPDATTTRGLLEELVGREIATRLRARYAEIMTRIHEQNADPAQRAAWLTMSEALNPDMWVTPEAILEGVRTADNLFERLRIELLHSSREREE